MSKEQIIIDGVDVSGWTDEEVYYKFEKHSPKAIRQIAFDLYKQLQRKEQECEKLSSLIRETETYSDVCCECRDEILTYPTIAGRTDYTQIEVEERSLKKIIQQLDQLKAEVKSKTEYIQEQRDIINQYSKEIEMYKKCQGKRASKREEEFKAENEQLKTKVFRFESKQTSMGKQNKELIEDNLNLSKENAKIKAENEELKEFQKLLEEQMKFNKSELELSLSSEIKRSEFLLKEFKKVDKQRDNWREKAEKLLKTLTDIKEIAEGNCKLCFSVDGFKKPDDCGICEYARILQKISEVEDG